MTDKRKKNILIIFGILLILISLFIYKLNFILGCVLSYIGLVLIAITIPDLREFNWIKLIILMPFAILGIIGPLLKFFVVFMCAYLMPFCVIALFYLKIPIYLFNIDLTYASNVYLTLVSSLIFITFFSEKLMIWFNEVFNGNNSKELTELYQNLGILLINKQRARYLIFFGFFLYLITYSLANLNEIELFEIKNVNVAIMQTFGTYIAFDRLMSNRSLFEFKYNVFQNKILKIWNFDFNKS